MNLFKLGVVGLTTTAFQKGFFLNQILKFKATFPNVPIDLFQV